MLRKINEFNGDALLVAGGWGYEHTFVNRKYTFRKPEHFYTVDIDPDVEPDAVLDITDAQQCAFLPDARFSLIYFECFRYHPEQTLKAFSIVRRMLKEDGILIYRGGSSIHSASISALLKKAGFVNAQSKMKFNDKDDNGSLSIASNMELEANLDKLSPVAKYYLHYYKFLDAEPLQAEKVESREEVEKDFLLTQGFFSTLTPISQKSFCRMYKLFYNRPYAEDTSSSSQAESRHDYESGPDCGVS